LCIISTRLNEVALSNKGEISTTKRGADASSFIEEAILVSKAQAGDKTAFALLVQPYIRLAYHVALRITGNREDAEDTSQLSLLKAYMRIDQFNGEARFSTWLTRIAINESLMKIRKRLSEEKYILRETDPDVISSSIETAHAADDLHPSAIYSRTEKKRILNEAIENLRGGTREVIRLHGIEERKIKETARLLNLSESAVKSRLLRGRQQLRQSLETRI
jgi:RNA polymerase sigma-70 factor (ECF subfamily)